MGDLSQDEIDSLMESEAEEAAEASGDGLSDDNLSAGGGVQPYDFRRPNRVPKEQKKTVSLIHQSYAQTVAVNLSAFLRTEISVTLHEVEQVSYQEYLMALMSPTCAATFDMQPLSGFGVIEVNSSLLFPIIDRMLGGDGNTGEISRSFTDMEIAIARKLLNILLDELGEAWQHVLKIKYSLQDIQTNPAFIRCIPIREPCIAIYLKVEIGETSGMVTICIPLVNLEPIASKLRNEQWNPRISTKQAGEVLAAHKNNFHQMQMNVKAILGHASLSMADILLLQPGDILTLDQKVRDPIDITVEGQCKFRANPGLRGRYKAVSIQQEILKEPS